MVTVTTMVMTVGRIKDLEGSPEASKLVPV